MTQPGRSESPKGPAFGGKGGWAGKGQKGQDRHALHLGSQPRSTGALRAGNPSWYFWALPSASNSPTSLSRRPRSLTPHTPSLGLSPGVYLWVLSVHIPNTLVSTELAWDREGENRGGTGVHNGAAEAAGQATGAWAARGWWPPAWSSWLWAEKRADPFQGTRTQLLAEADRRVQVSRRLF